MKLDIFKRFAKDEDGAVTVDWVVLTAALVGLGIAVLAAVSGGLEDLSNDIASQLSDTDVNSGFAGGGGGGGGGS